MTGSGEYFTFSHITLLSDVIKIL